MRNFLAYYEGRSVRFKAKMVRTGVRRSLMKRDTRRGMKKTILLLNVEIYDEYDNYLGLINHLWLDYEKILQDVTMHEPFECWGKVIRYKKGSPAKYKKLPSQYTVSDLLGEYDYTLRHLYKLNLNVDEVEVNKEK